MYNHLLDTFIIVADEKSLTKASEKLFISVPGVMKQINQLESELNLKLFDRTAKGMELTKAGKIIYEKSINYIELSKKIISEAINAENKKQKIRIGFFYTNEIKYFLTLIGELKDISKTYDIDIVSLQENRFNIKNWFKEVDFIYSYYDNYKIIELFDFYELNTFNPYVTLSIKNKLSDKKILNLKDIEGQKLELIENGKSEFIDKLKNKINNFDIKVCEYRTDNNKNYFNSKLDSKTIIFNYDLGELYPGYKTVEFDSGIKMKAGLIFPRNLDNENKKFLRELDKVLKRKAKEQ